MFLVIFIFKNLKFKCMLKVEVLGNLGADAEIKAGQGQKFVAMRIAHTERYNKQGQEVVNTVWIDAILNDSESKIIPYLKKGQQVFVRGNASLRVYSSPSAHMMKAGLTVNIREIELVGGHTDAVPRRLIDPSNNAIIDVNKYFGVNPELAGKELIDKGGSIYNVVEGGWITIPENSTANNNGVTVGTQIAHDEHQDVSEGGSKRKKASVKNDEIF